LILVYFINDLAYGCQAENTYKIAEFVLRVQASLTYHKGEDGHGKSPDDAECVNIREQHYSHMVYKHTYAGNYFECVGIHM
jgi:hypothetical protein